MNISYCYQAVSGVSGGAMFSAQSVERGKGINEGLKREELIPLRSQDSRRRQGYELSREPCSVCEPPCRMYDKQSS